MNRLFLLLALAPSLAASQVRYTLTPEPANQSVRVSITTEAKSDQTAFRLPAWVPGFYVILHNERKISDVKAVDASGQPLQLSHTADPHEWTVASPKHGALTLSYRVLGDDPGLGFFAVNVRPSTAFVNGAAAFMYVEGRKEEPTTLAIRNPQGWEISTSMGSNPDGTFHSRDYDELVDHPIDLGHFVRRQFRQSGALFEAVFVTQGDLYPASDADYEAARLAKLVQPAIAMFGGTPPFKKYVFHLHLQVGNFGGGLEHQASVTIATSQRKPLGIDDLVTHEFFHAWNVKNIRPKVLGPFDYTKEVRTDNLWFAEGVTDYYAKLHAYRSGLNGAESYLFPALAGEIATYENGNTRKTSTLADASRGAWEGGSQGTGDLSYYNKGQLVGWILDAMIRAKTNGSRSLDDVMRLMMAKYHLPNNPGYEENGILLAINEVAGQDFSELYHKLVYTTDEMPYGLLENIGMRVVGPGQEYLALGFSVDDNGNVTDVDPEVERQGLQQGDRVVSLNGLPFGPSIPALTKEGYRLSIRRGSEGLRLDLKPVVQQSQNVVVEPDPFATPQQVALREAWLSRPSGVKQ